jgi:hypothetical protein
MMSHNGENSMFGFLKANPEKKLQAKYERLLEQAMQLQRKGDIRGYSTITAEAEEVLAELQKLKPPMPH